MTSFGNPSSPGEVVITTLDNPPARQWPDAGMTYLIASSARRTPGNVVPDWDPKDLTGGRESIKYVRMNSCAIASFDGPGFIATGNLNGCTALVAAYRDGRENVQTFLGHYDAEAVRETDDDRELRLSGLLGRFAGEQAIQVAVAYSEANNPAPTYENYDPEDFPVHALIRACQRLPRGSRVLLIPYATSHDFDDPTIGHMLHAGLSGAYSMTFGWNGHTVEVGKHEEFDEARRQAARAFAAVYEEDYDTEG